MNFFGHFVTITRHKLLVMKGCFKLGLYSQGLLHDLSKYSPSEFLPSCKYYQNGKRSPISAQREKEGHSKVWLHHKGRNRHHFEYWIDNSATGENGMMAVEMPNRYVAEMFVDRVCASKNYLKDKYTQEEPLKYFLAGKDSYYMNEKTKQLLEKLLTILATEGEDKAYSYIRKNLLNQK